MRARLRGAARAGPVGRARLYCSPPRPPAGGLARARPPHQPHVAAVRAGAGGGALDAAGDRGPGGARPARGAERQGGGDGAGLLPVGGQVPGPGGQRAGARGGRAPARPGAGGHLPRARWCWRSTRPSTPSAAAGRGRPASAGATWSTSAGCASRTKGGGAARAARPTRARAGRRSRAPRRRRATRARAAARERGDDRRVRGRVGRAGAHGQAAPAPGAGPVLQPPSHPAEPEQGRGSGPRRGAGRCSSASAGRRSSSPTGASGARSCSSRWRRGGRQRQRLRHPGRRRRHGLHARAARRARCWTWCSPRSPCWARSCGIAGQEGTLRCEARTVTADHPLQPHRAPARLHRGDAAASSSCSAARWRHRPPRAGDDAAGRHASPTSRASSACTRGDGPSKPRSRR